MKLVPLADRVVLKQLVEDRKTERQKDRGGCSRSWRRGRRQGNQDGS